MNRSFLLNLYSPCAILLSLIIPSNLSPARGLFSRFITNRQAIRFRLVKNFENFFIAYPFQLKFLFFFCPMTELQTEWKFVSIANCIYAKNCRLSILVTETIRKRWLVSFSINQNLIVDYRLIDGLLLPVLSTDYNKQKFSTHKHRRWMIRT